jgi:hypothetical protein
LERDPSDSDFSVVGLSYSDSEAVITLAGELDLAGVPVLQACLLEAAAGGADTIEVGFARVTYSTRLDWESWCQLTSVYSQEGEFSSSANPANE